jgi:hypothetical protein
MQISTGGKQAATSVNSSLKKVITHPLLRAANDHGQNF